MKELAARDRRVTIRWRAFELRPEPVPTLDPDGAYLVSAWQNHVYPLAAAMRMDLQRPPIQPRSRLAHEAAKWAATQGSFAPYHLGLFRTFFQQGKDIGALEILTGLAAELQLDANSLQVSLQNGDFTATVLADEQEAGRVGVRAVPAFVVHGRLQAAGVQSAERLQELVARPAHGE